MLIGLTGYAQHGKDTVANILVEEYGYHRVAFADALKELAWLVNPSIPGHGRLQSLVDTLGWEAAKALPEVRRILQDLGTGARSIIGPNVWVQAAERSMLGSSPVVISDVRFPNEAEFISRHSGELWRVTRVNPDATPYDNGVGTTHPSEAHVATLPAKKHIVAATVEQLHEVVRYIMGDKPLREVMEVPVWVSSD